MKHWTAVIVDNKHFVIYYLDSNFNTENFLRCTNVCINDMKYDINILGINRLPNQTCSIFA